MGFDLEGAPLIAQRRVLEHFAQLPIVWGDVSERDYRSLANAMTGCDLVRPGEALQPIAVLTNTTLRCGHEPFVSPTHDVDHRTDGPNPATVG